jgi:hypothetical protein
MPNKSFLVPVCKRKPLTGPIHDFHLAKNSKVRPQVQRHTVSRDRFTLRTSGDAPSQYCRNVKDTQSFSSHYCLS